MSLDRSALLARRAVLGIAGVATSLVLVGPILASSPPTEGSVPSPFAVTATIPAGRARVTIELKGIELQTGAVAVCSLQSNPGPRSLTYVSVNVANNSFTVHLSGKAIRPIAVACMAFAEPPSWGIPGPISEPVSEPISGPVSEPVSEPVAPPGGVPGP
jgi:hypothetical protein